MVGWHYELNGVEFQQTPGDDEGQGSLSCTPCCHKELDMTKLNDKSHTQNQIQGLFSPLKSYILQGTPNMSNNHHSMTANI